MKGDIKVVNYKYAVSYLRMQKETYEEEIGKLQKTIDDVKATNDGTTMNIGKLIPSLEILKKYDYLRYIDSIFDKSFFINYINVMYKTNPISKQFALKKINKVNIEDNKFLDSMSFITTLDQLYTVLYRKGDYKIKDGKITQGKNKKISDEELDMLYKLLMTYVTDFCTAASDLVAKLRKYLDKTSSLLDILEELKQIDVGLELESFKNCLDKYSKAIRNDELFKNDDLNSLNLELREEYRLVEKNKSRKKESQDNAAAIIKSGKREDRKAMYQKNKLFLEIGALKEELNEDSKTWVELILEQIKEDSDSFVQNPSMYLPGFKEDQSCLIKDIILKELMYNDADEKIINALKNI